MSGEFRETSGYFRHSVLNNISERGEQHLSQLLFDVYQSLAPLETSCAWVEACDSGADSLLADTFEHAEKAIVACRTLIAHFGNCQKCRQETLERLARRIA
jgi:hypothetical protein